ncbi:MAG TPA: Na(+)-translocating NADH-quinone reductase subunit C [Candidatus Deferrimicrobium sp.]|nr:Na(+)-translocating NADH-quinone reductase subunit C [Candidatus Deferrimicrobium sp.]
MPNENLKNIIGVALVVCLACSILVAAATVILKARQETNQRLEKMKNILLAGDLMPETGEIDVEAVFAEKIRPVLIELKTGEPVLPEKIKANDNLAPEKFDIKIVSKDPAASRLIPRPEDMANIRRAPLYMPVYFVKAGKKEEDFDKIILPVYGSGLWSTIYGFLALDKDLKTVRGFTVYEHGETPGLGGEIVNPAWQGSWKGKTAFSDNGELVLKIVKQRPAPKAAAEIDGLSGATLTTRGVDNFIHFWLGPAGYGPFLAKLKSQPGTH